MKSNLLILKNIFLSALLFITLSSFCLPIILSDSDKIIGTYWSPDKDGKISIYKRNGKYYGKSVASNTPELKDINNPNPSLRDKIVLGQEVFFDFTYDEDDDEYEDGKIYNPLDGKTYNAKMWLDDTDLKLRGYVGISLFGMTKTLERVK